MSEIVTDTATNIISDEQAADIEQRLANLIRDAVKDSAE